MYQRDAERLTAKRWDSVNCLPLMFLVLDGAIKLCVNGISVSFKNAPIEPSLSQFTFSSRRVDIETMRTVVRGVEREVVVETKSNVRCENLLRKRIRAHG